MDHTNILLVEDDRMDIELTLDAFREVNLEDKIFVVHTGEEALDYLNRRKQFQDRRKYSLPNLILLDLELPGIGGLDVLREIRQTPVIKRIPVIILTSSTEESDRIAGYDNGANSYLEKNVLFDDFLDVVCTIVKYWLKLNVKPPLYNVR